MFYVFLMVIFVLGIALGIGISDYLNREQILSEPMDGKEAIKDLKELLKKDDRFDSAIAVCNTPNCQHWAHGLKKGEVWPPKR